MEQLRATLGSLAQLVGDGLLTPAEAAEMKAAAMQDFATTRCGYRYPRTILEFYCQS